jgi:hypothetical protein
LGCLWRSHGMLETDEIGAEPANARYGFAARDLRCSPEKKYQIIKGA